MWKTCYILLLLAEGSLEAETAGTHKHMRHRKDSFMGFGMMMRTALETC